MRAGPRTTWRKKIWHPKKRRSAQRPLRRYQARQPHTLRQRLPVLAKNNGRPCSVAPPRQRASPRKRNKRSKRRCCTYGRRAWCFLPCMRTRCSKKPRRWACVLYLCTTGACPLKKSRRPYSYCRKSCRRAVQRLIRIRYRHRNPCAPPVWSSAMRTGTFQPPGSCSKAAFTPCLWYRPCRPLFGRWACSSACNRPHCLHRLRQGPKASVETHAAAILRRGLAGRKPPMP